MTCPRVVRYEVTAAGAQALAEVPDGEVWEDPRELEAAINEALANACCSAEDLRSLLADLRATRAGARGSGGG